MWPEVSQIRQPHNGVLEANKQTEQNEFENERGLYLRALEAGKLAGILLGRTDYEPSGSNYKGGPYCMRGNPVDLGQLPGEAGERGLHKFKRVCLVVGQQPFKVAEQGRRLRKTSLSYVPNLNDILKVGVIDLAGPVNGSEPTHIQSAHWSCSEPDSLKEVPAIEEGLEAIQNALGKLTIVQNEIAS